jgi:hypothetical protein
MLDASMQLPGIQLEVFGIFRHKIYLQSLFIAVWFAAILLTVRFGITAVALAYCALQLVRSIALHWISARSLDASVWSSLGTWLPGLACSGAVAGALYFIQQLLQREDSMRPGLQLLVLIAFGVILSVLFYRTFFRATVYNPWVGLFRGAKHAGGPGGAPTGSCASRRSEERLP